MTPMDVLSQLDELWSEIGSLTGQSEELAFLSAQLEAWDPLWVVVLDENGQPVRLRVESTPGAATPEPALLKRVHQAVLEQSVEGRTIVSIDHISQIEQVLAICDPPRCGEACSAIAMGKPVAPERLADDFATNAGMELRLTLLEEQRAFLTARAEQLRAENASLKLAQMQAVQQAIEEHEQLLLAQRESEAMKELLQAIEEANQTKRDFLANMSHELRTPLHAVLSYAAFGLKKTQDESLAKLRRYFEQIEKSGQTLLEFVNDLLDYSKLEAGKMTYKFARHDVRELVDSICDEMRSLAVQRELEIEHKSRDGELWTECDGTRLGQVVRNVLSNAVKFARPSSTIVVRSRLSDGTVAIEVENRGDHIPDKELERVFEGYVQSSKHTGGPTGMGLGLAICRKIIAQHHGSIWAENVPDGVVFHIHLPVAHAPHESADAETPTEETRLVTQ